MGKMFVQLLRWGGQAWKSGEGCVVLVVPTTPVKATLNCKERRCDTRGS